MCFTCFQKEKGFFQNSSIPSNKGEKQVDAKEKEKEKKYIPKSMFFIIFKLEFVLKQIKCLNSEREETVIEN